MPLYEYECSRCGRFEKIQKFADKPLKVCPTCGGKKVQRLLSAPAIQFKGSGWYITDYARAAAKPDDKAKGDSKPDDSKAPAAKDASEGKPKSKSSEKKAAAPSGSKS